MVEFIPYASHPEAIKYMVSSSALLLIIPDHESNKSIVTGKLFEYLASGRPVILIGPKDGDAAEIVEKCKAGKSFGYDEASEIGLFILNLAAKKIKNNISAINTFSRKNLAYLISALLR